MYRERKFSTFKPKHTCECDHPYFAHKSFGECVMTECLCLKYRKRKLPNKLHAVRQEHNGRMYHSGLEARVAADLHFQKECGEYVEIIPQFKIDFVINGIKILRYYVDFKAIKPDGTFDLIEAKGMVQQLDIIKQRLMEAVYLPEHPEAKYIVVKER